MSQVTIFSHKKQHPIFADLTSRQKSEVVTFAENKYMQTVAMFANSQDMAYAAIYKYAQSLSVAAAQKGIQVSLLRRMDSQTLYKICEALACYAMQSHTGASDNLPLKFGIIDVLEGAYYLTVPELFLVIRDGISGKLGKTYKLTPETVSEWVNTFFMNQKAEYHEKRNINAKKQLADAGVHAQIAKTIRTIVPQNPKLN